MNNADVLATATAPGKMVLMGEYVVLEGAPALAAAVDCQARATYRGAVAGSGWRIEAVNLGCAVALEDVGGRLQVCSRASAPQLALAVALLQAAYAQSGAQLPCGTLQLDTSAFYAGGKKMGLGSSAAVAVAAWHALQLLQDPIAPGQSVAAAQQQIAAVQAVHQNMQGGKGSGIDVATSTLGGVIRYQLPNLPGSLGSASTPATPLPPDTGPVWLPIVVGQPASTPQFLQAYAALKQERPQVYWQHAEELAQLSVAACELWALGAKVAFLPLVQRYLAGLQALGQSMQMPVVTPEHQALAAIVVAHGGAYKPSGAGGGDVGVAFCLDARDAKRLRRALRHTPYRVLDCGASLRGVTGSGPR